MKRFLIFIGLFPGIALAVLIALVSIGAGALPDKQTAVELAGRGYAVGVIPALICGIPAAVCSWLSGKVKQAGPDGTMRRLSGEAR